MTNVTMKMDPRTINKVGSLFGHKWKSLPVPISKSKKNFECNGKLIISEHDPIVVEAIHDAMEKAGLLKDPIKMISYILSGSEYKHSIYNQIEPYMVIPFDMSMHHQIIKAILLEEVTKRQAASEQQTLLNQMNSRFDQMDNKFNSIEHKFSFLDNMQDQINVLNEKLAKVINLCGLFATTDPNIDAMAEINKVIAELNK